MVARGAAVGKQLHVGVPRSLLGSGWRVCEEFLTRAAPFAAQIAGVLEKTPKLASGECCRRKGCRQHLKCCSTRATSVRSFREFTRMVKRESKDLLFEAALEVVEGPPVARGRVKGNRQNGNHRSDCADLFTGKLPYSGSMPQFLFERMTMKHYFSFRMLNLTLKSATQVYACSSVECEQLCVRLHVWTSLLFLNGCCGCSIVLGSLYPDMSPQDQKKDDAVFPGGNYTYTWTVPEDHSPTADDPNCLTWIYHSHIDAPKDIASGLIGPLLTCKKGKNSREGS